jgi:hypothetical protein
MIVYGGALVNSASYNASMNPTVTPTEPATREATCSEPYQCDSTRANYFSNE